MYPRIVFYEARFGDDTLPYVVVTNDTLPHMKDTIIIIIILLLLLLLLLLMCLSTNDERACAQTKHFRRIYQSILKV